MSTGYPVGRSEGRTGPLFTVLSDDTAGTKTRDFHNTVTLDKSSFYYTAYHELILLPHDGKVMDPEGVAVQSKKMMVIIMSGPTGFTFVTAIESGCKFNAGYYVSKSLTSLCE
jgi:hypothetical protein